MTPSGIGTPTATHPEIAAFLRLALDAKLATVDEVVRWADSVVLSEARPPNWSIDLALCRTWPLQRVNDALAAASVGADGDVVRWLLAARLAGAVRRGELDAQRAIALAWSLPFQKADLEPFDALTRAVFATSECLDGVEEGWMTPEAAAAIFREAFEPFAPREWRASAEVDP
jgi:hypothetical protein